MFRARLVLVAVAALAASAASTRAEGDWTIETVATGTLVPDVSVALDPAGVPCVAYNAGGQPQFARRGAVGWTTEALVTPPVLTPAGVARSGAPMGVQILNFVTPSLAVDAVTALPRIAYGKSPESDVWYAERAESGWTYERLSTSGESPSLALDTQGRPHVVYHDAVTGLTYAVRVGATWTLEPVGAGLYGRGLRLDAQDHPHVAVSLAGPNADLLLASRDGGGWSVGPADTSGDVGYAASLALDGSGAPHISYLDATAHALRYATRSGGVWTVETVMAPVGDACPSSLALDPAGRPFVAFHDVGAGDLRFARREPGGWVSEVVDSAGIVGDFCSLALDGQGRPHIGYYDRSNDRVRYATSDAVVGVAAPAGPPGAGIARLSPNPLRAGRALELALRLEAPGEVRVELLDPAGRRVAAREAEASPAGARTIRWDPGIRRAGLYFLRVRSDRGDRFGARLVVLP